MCLEENNIYWSLRMKKKKKKKGKKTFILGKFDIYDKYLQLLPL
jgi:hypothetical protein